MSRPSVVDRVSIADILRLAGFPPPGVHGFVCCPLHAERTPSFHVIGNGRAWRCFGCGRRGSILDLPVALGVVRDRAGAARWLEGRTCR